MTPTTNILLAGVGGQGIITASRVLAEVALIAGWEVKKSEIHGMSQRGGSVESHVRIRPEGPVYSPLIPAGETDLLLGFEMLETLRGLPMTRPDALVIADDRRIIPTSVTSGLAEYPSDPAELLRQSGRRVVIVPGFQVACEMGDPRAANIAVLGAASRTLQFADELWSEAIHRVVRREALELNLKAFAAGARLMDEATVGELGPPQAV